MTSTAELGGLDLGDLLRDLGISGDLLNLSQLPDLLDPTVDDLLGDLGLGDLASVDVSTFGGLITELVDTIPGQIVTSI